mgnify:CR=1 FL=1
MKDNFLKECKMVLAHISLQMETNFQDASNKEQSKATEHTISYQQIKF